MRQEILESLYKRRDEIQQVLNENEDTSDSSDPPLHDQHVRDYQRWLDQQAPQIVPTRLSPKEIDDVMREVRPGGIFPGFERPEWWTRERKRK